jgi:PAS domain S-box-containing protein
MPEDKRNGLLDTDSSLFTRLLSGFEDIGTYEWRVSEDRLYWSPELRAIYGLDQPPGAEPGFTELVHPDDRTRVEAETSALLGSGTTYAHEFRIVRPDGEVRTVHDRGLIERNEDGSVQRLLGLNIDITGLRQEQFNSEDKLRQNEARLQLAYDVADIGAWDVDFARRQSVWTTRLYQLLGVDPERQVSDGLFFEHVHPDDRPWLRERYDRAISEGSVFDEVFRVVRSDGEVRHLVGKGRVVKQVDGDPARMIGVNYDITDRIEAEEQNDLLAREIHHRFKNMLSLVQAIARQTMKTRPEDFLERFSARIQGLSSAQDMLVYNMWTGVDVLALIHSQLAHMKDAIDRRIKLSGPAVKLKADAAQALGMAIHELATNAGKYGALAGEKGEVSIDWSLDRNSSGVRQFVISWTERGGPRVEKPDSLGFGSVVMNKMTSAAMNAQVEVDFAPEGLSWTLHCPDDCVSDAKTGSPAPTRDD